MALLRLSPWPRLVLHPHTSLPILEPPFPRAAPRACSLPVVPPQQLPKCLCPASLSQRAPLRALAPSDPRACAPHPTPAPRAAPGQRSPKPASLGPPLATLLAPRAALPAPPRFSWAGPGQYWGSSCPGPAVPMGMVPWGWRHRGAGSTHPARAVLVGHHVHLPQRFWWETGRGMQLLGEAGLPQGPPQHQRPSRCCWRLDFVAAGGAWGQHLCGAGQEPLPRALLRTEAPALYILLLL